MKTSRAILAAFSFAAAATLVAAHAPFAIPAQTPSPRSAEKPQDKSRGKSAAKAAPEVPAQIELLETRVRFELNGDSRKEVHARVRINDELGVRQFARLNFDFNRASQKIEIPLVRITHPSGGTVDVLPSAITDTPNPAVATAPSYQDIRIKSVRILGLEPGDSLEYRVITSTSHSLPDTDFWLEHTFDHSGVVAQELFQVTFPAPVLAKIPSIVVSDEKVQRQLEARLLDSSQNNTASGTAEEPKTMSAAPSNEPLPGPENGKVQLLLKPGASHPGIEQTGEADGGQTVYTWTKTNPPSQSSAPKDASALDELPDIEIGKESTWLALSYDLFQALALPQELPAEVVNLAEQLTTAADSPIAKLERIYDFVSQKIGTVDLPLGATRFRLRPLAEIISSGYATQEDKVFLFQALAKAAHLESQAALIGQDKNLHALIANPAAFAHILVGSNVCNCWLDPALEVAPFGALPAPYRGGTALLLGADHGPLTDLPASSMLVQIPKDLPFPSSQRVSIDAKLDVSGRLVTKARYTMRGDNELLLRVAFHQAPKEKWNQVAQLLALSDGFRGQIANVTASDPYDTRKPFTVEFEVTQPKFLDWSRKPLRIPALLPLLGLPDPATRTSAGDSAAPIDLGTPLDVTVSATVHLPVGTVAHIPTGTSVARDFATFTSQYSAKESAISASRHLNFILKQLPADRAADYDAFLRAVQNDESQYFTLERATAPPSTTKP